MSLNRPFGLLLLIILDQGLVWRSYQACHPLHLLLQSQGLHRVLGGTRPWKSNMGSQTQERLKRNRTPEENCCTGNSRIIYVTTTAGP